MSAPQAICPDIFLAGSSYCTTRRLNMRILRRLPCKAVYKERCSAYIFSGVINVPIDVSAHARYL